MHILYEGIYLLYQNLYGKIDEADYQLNQIGQHLRHTNGSKDPTDQQVRHIILCDKAEPLHVLQFH